MDHISNVLAATQPGQILEVLAQMKVRATSPLMDGT